MKKQRCVCVFFFFNFQRKTSPGTMTLTIFTTGVNCVLSLEFRHVQCQLICLVILLATFSALARFAPLLLPHALKHRCWLSCPSAWGMCAPLLPHSKLALFQCHHIIAPFHLCGYSICHLRWGCHGSTIFESMAHIKKR